MYTDEEYDIAQKEYWRQVSESEGFDVENVSIPSSMAGMISGLIPFDCQRDRGGCPYRVLVNLYGQLGLRQYVFLKEKKFELVSMVKVNMAQNLVSSYYITLLVLDPLTLEEKEFQVRTDERSCVSLYVACSEARLKDEVITMKRPFVPHFHDGAEVPVLPYWPADTLASDTLALQFSTTLNTRWSSSDTPGPSDTSARPGWLPSDSMLRQFYSLLPPIMHPDDFVELCVLEESRCRSPRYDWTYLYLKLIVCAHDRCISEELLSKLEIIYAVIIPLGGVHGPVEMVNYLLERTLLDLHLFISFKGLGTAGIGEDVERKAVVSQVVNSRGYLSLRGKLLEV